MARGGEHMVHSHPGGGLWLEMVSTLVHSHPGGGLWLEMVSTWCILIQEVVCG